MSDAKLEPFYRVLSFINARVGDLTALKRSSINFPQAKFTLLLCNVSRLVLQLRVTKS